MTQPASVDPDALHDWGSRVLAAAGQFLTSAGFAPPERQFVTVGQPGQMLGAPGCELLVVQLGGLVAGTPGQEQRLPQRCVTPTVSACTVTLLRCVPTLDDGGRVPSAEEMDGAGLSLAQEGWVLWRGFQTLLLAVPTPLVFRGIVGPMQALRPAASLGGWQLTLTGQV